MFSLLLTPTTLATSFPSFGSPAWYNSYVSEHQLIDQTEASWGQILLTHSSCLAQCLAHSRFPVCLLLSWIELNLPVGTWQIAPWRNDSQAVLLQRPLVSAKTQSPKMADSSSFQKVKEDLDPSDQSKLRPFCGGKWSHHFFARTAGGFAHCCLSSPYFKHIFIFPHLDFFFRGSRTACEYGLTKRNKIICHNNIVFGFGNPWFPTTITFQ